MITPISINRQNINFQARAKMDKQSKKVGQYFEDHNIDVNKVLIASGVSAAGAAGVLLGSPDMVSAPDAAKYGIILPMVSTAGAMGVNHYAAKKNPSAVQDSSEIATDAKGRDYTVKSPIGKIKLTQQGLVDYERLLEGITTEEGNISYVKNLERNGRDIWRNEVQILAQGMARKDRYLAQLNLLSQVGDFNFEDNKIYRFKDEYGSYSLNKEEINKYFELLTGIMRADFKINYVNNLKKYHRDVWREDVESLSKGRADKDQCINKLKLLSAAKH